MGACEAKSSRHAEVNTKLPEAKVPTTSQHFDCKIVLLGDSGMNSFSNLFLQMNPTLLGLRSHPIEPSLL